MDVDEVEVEFEVTPVPDEQGEQDQHALVAQFTPFPFTHETRDAIFARRSAMSDELVFDLLLEQASIASPQSLYPPDSPDSLLELLEAIANCPWDMLKKWCLQFYLLSHVSPDVAAQHAMSCALPPQFVHLAHACFLLDSGSSEDLARAVTLLSDARIVQDLSPKILQTLSLAPQPDSSRLVRTYVRTAQPVLEEYEDLAIYLRALLDYSLADAWSFQRTFSETTPIRNQLIRTVLDSCLIPPKPSVLPHFLSLPLTFFEFSLLQSYALSPPEELSTAAHAILQDLITVRLLHSGKYSDAVRISRAFDTLNAKSRSTTATSLHKAAEERQQMMRDVLAVVPEVQRRQLELELSDEQGDPLASLSASWASVGNDVSMSWDNLGASTSAKAREKVMGGPRSGRLEGSPAPALPGRSHVSAPFGPFTPGGSAQKRKASANINANINVFGTPAKDTPTRTPIFPQIPTPGLATSTSAVIPAITGLGFRQGPRPSFTPPSRPFQGSQNGNGPGPRLGVGLNARNAFYEPEPSRADPSLFARQSQGATGSSLATPTKRVNGEGKLTPGTRIAQTSADGPAVGIQGSALGEPDDIMMVESDDPDGFVVRGRRKPPVYHQPVQNGETYTKGDASQRMDGPTSLFARGTANVQKSDEGRTKETKEARVLPGGFTSVELTEDDEAPSSSRQAANESTQTPRNEPRPSRTRAYADKADTQPPSFTPSSRLKIPGALFEEDAEAEEQDHVPSLPPVPMKGGRRKRTSRARSVVTDSEEDDQPRTPLRRSSRLSSTGPSPEPLSPNKPEQKTGSKRTTRATADGTARRKRKNTED